MTYAPGDRIMIDPAYVHSVGQQVKADAQKLLGSEPATSGQQANFTLFQEIVQFNQASRGCSPAVLPAAA
jgi:hypothetical protein